MLSTSVAYLHRAVTITEGLFNVGGYLPKHYFPKINKSLTDLRLEFGKWQMISGLAVAAIGFLVDCIHQAPSTISKSFTYGQLMMNFGFLYANHGALNMIRGYIEKKGFSFLTAAYDFYGRKFLPAIAPDFDFQQLAFEGIRRQLDRIYFVTLFPPRIVLRDG